MKALMIILLVLISSQLVLGQSIINAERIGSDTDSLKFAVSLNYSGARGNQNTDVGGVASTFIRKTKKHQWKVFGGYSLFNSGGVSVNKTGHVHARHNYRLNSHISTQLFSQWQFNEVLLFKERAVAGTGLRAALINKDSLSWDVALGPIYEYELLNRSGLAVGEVAKTNFWRLNLLSSFSWDIKSWCSFTSVIYSQWHISNWKDYRLLNDSFISFKLTKALRLFTGLNLRYDSDPVMSLSPFDFSVSSGLDLVF